MIRTDFRSYLPLNEQSNVRNCERPHFRGGMEHHLDAAARPHLPLPSRLYVCAAELHALPQARAPEGCEAGMWGLLRHLVSIGVHCRLGLESRKLPTYIVHGTTLNFKSRLILKGKEKLSV